MNDYLIIDKYIRIINIKLIHLIHLSRHSILAKLNPRTGRVKALAKLKLPFGLDKFACLG